jgi:hypothetical protein
LRTSPTAFKRHHTVQKWQIQPSTISITLKEKLPATTEKLRNETDKQRRGCTNQRGVVIEVAATRRERREWVSVKCNRVGSNL